MIIICLKIYNLLKYNDMKIQVELNLEDVFEEAMYNEATLKEEFTSSVRLAVVRELKEKFKNELMREISNPISEKIEDIARESMNDLVENASEKKYRFRLDYMDEELTVDEFIRGRMKKVVDRNIETMVESKAKSFVNELRKRYDMAFAAFIVDNMRKQNMLKDEKIAELLKIIQMRGREDAKGRRRSVLMTPPVPEKVRVLSPAWYRAAVEFQGRPEQERLAFCSWCCCHGGCNLCADISKYNIKGLKIYGG